jgi:lysophospholipid acyltransferase (LPLAT)-like uncharacterized protein
MSMTDKRKDPMKKFTDWLLMNVALPLIIVMLKLLSLTYSYKVIGGENVAPYQDKKGTFIYAFWHCGLIAPVLYYRNQGVVSLVSLSKDGEIAARVARSFGFVIQRGSTFKGAARGLKELKDLLDGGHDVAMNTDGPRGPAENVAGGVIYLAKLTGKPVVPFGSDWDRKIRLRSWDRFMIPLLFAKCVFKFGTPVYVSGDATGDEIEAARQAMIVELKKLNRECGEEIAGK